MLWTYQKHHRWPSNKGNGCGELAPVPSTVIPSIFFSVFNKAQFPNCPLANLQETGQNLWACSRDTVTTDAQQSHCGASQLFRQNGEDLVCYSGVLLLVPIGSMVALGTKKCQGKEIQLLLESYPELGPFLYGVGGNITQRNLPATFEGACGFQPSSLLSKWDSSYLDMPQAPDLALFKALGTDVIFLCIAVPVLQHPGCIQ